MKTVLIGLGRMGRRHLENVAALGLDLVGMCDAQTQALEAAQQDWSARTGKGPVTLSPDAATLLHETRPACVIVATTAPSHAELTCLAASCGARLILCEKPMAVSLEQCDRMLETCQRHRVQLAINHPMRYMDRLVEVRTLVETPAFGLLDSMVTVGANIGLAMNGTHRFEAFHYLTEQPPQEVTAWFSRDRLPNPRGPQFEDRAGTVQVINRTGQRLHLEIGANQGHGLLSIYNCRYGQILVDELEGILTSNCRQAAYRDRPTAQYLNPSERQSRTIQAAEATAPSRALLRALLDQGDYPTGQEGRLAVATLIAAYVSHEEGHRPTPVDDQLPKGRLFPWA